MDAHAIPCMTLTIYHKANSGTLIVATSLHPLKTLPFDKAHIFKGNTVSLFITKKTVKPFFAKFLEIFFPLSLPILSWVIFQWVVPVCRCTDNTENSGKVYKSLICG